MKDEYFKIKDNCRKGLTQYLASVCKNIPELHNPEILDVGCGSGVPTLWLAGHFSGKITVIDPDKESIDYLQKKITAKNLQDKIETLCTSLDEFNCETGLFDIILAEGLLNIVGFETGFLKIVKFLKKNGYLIIHDEFKDHDQKMEFIRSNNCTVIETLYLDEKVWWNDYYRQLEIEIKNISDPLMIELFKRDIEEISYYKTMTHLFRSIYYILKKDDGIYAILPRAW